MFYILQQAQTTSSEHVLDVAGNTDDVDFSIFTGATSSSGVSRTTCSCATSYECVILSCFASASRKLTPSVLVATPKRGKLTSL
jgi:hypothetical protein